MEFVTQMGHIRFDVVEEILTQLKVSDTHVMRARALDPLRLGSRAAFRGVVCHANAVQVLLVVHLVCVRRGVAQRQTKGARQAR